MKTIYYLYIVLTSLIATSGILASQEDLNAYGRRAIERGDLTTQEIQEQSNRPVQDVMITEGYYPQEKAVMWPLGEVEEESKDNN